MTPVPATVISWFALAIGLLYSFSILGLSIFSLHVLMLSALFIIHRRSKVEAAPVLAQWPLVTVQLPIYNERYVAERLLDAACALDYPTDCLQFQVLDDSTDDTSARIEARANYWRTRGFNIEILRRHNRHGFKAGALAEAMPQAIGEFLAIFDADFVPPVDFLRRAIPYFYTQPNIGMVQTRWGHLNADFNIATRAQALTLDGHMVVEQTARSRVGLLFNFNGSAGIWRRACIEAAGGWQTDTLSEDLDLSYRAQIAGWRLLYVPHIIAPAEIPPQIAAFKRQQYRWAQGSIQALYKLFLPLWRSRLSFTQRIFGTLHIASYLAHPLMLLLILTSLPLVLMRPTLPPIISLASVAGCGPLIIYSLAQWAAYNDWPKRLASFPFLLFIGVGIAFNNTLAILSASRRGGNFTRTPKFGAGAQTGGWQQSDYALPLDWKILIEIGIAIYAVVALGLAIERMPSMVPLLVIGAFGFGYTGWLSLWQHWQMRRPAISPPAPRTVSITENYPSRLF